MFTNPIYYRKVLFYELHGEEWPPKRHTAIWDWVMKVDSFDYQLPKQIIAQTPLEKRSSSKLLVLNRCLGTMEDHYFRELPAF